MFCHASLGNNEAIEHLPVGRRLAFDAAKGRLWAVCRDCERWNLSPLEERWEAIEECERLFRDTKLRVSTENIGLARLKEGTTLVRIGDPQRPVRWRRGVAAVSSIGGGQARGGRCCGRSRCCGGLRGVRRGDWERFRRVVCRRLSPCGWRRGARRVHDEVGQLAPRGFQYAARC